MVTMFQNFMIIKINQIYFALQILFLVNVNAQIVSKVEYDGSEFTVCKVDVQKSEVKMYNFDDKRRPFNYF